MLNNRLISHKIDELIEIYAEAFKVKGFCSSSRLLPNNIISDFQFKYIEKNKYTDKIVNTVDYHIICEIRMRAITDKPRPININDINILNKLYDKYANLNHKLRIKENKL